MQKEIHHNLLTVAVTRITVCPPLIIHSLCGTTVMCGEIVTLLFLLMSGTFMDMVYLVRQNMISCLCYKLSLLNHQ
jgi:hypothetical protein